MNVLLIHGAWQGSWAWDRLVPLLRQAGLLPHAIDLPGNGTDDTPLEDVSQAFYVDHIGRLLDRMDGPVVLVGHSGGGVLATDVAERYAGRITGVAYLAGMMLPSGMGFADLLVDSSAAERGMAGIGAHLEWSHRRTVSRVPADAAMDIFYHDVDPTVAREAADRLTPQAERGRALVARWTQARFGALPRLYIECIKDRSVVIDLQRTMQRLVPGADIVSLDTGHAPQLAAPHWVAEALMPFLEQALMMRT